MLNCIQIEHITLKYIEDITRWREDMNFLFEWKYCSCHENIKFTSLSQRVMFLSLYRHTDDGVIDDFPKIFDHFAKISEDFPKLVRRSHEGCRAFSKTFPKVTEDSRRFPKIALRDKLHNSESIDILTSEDMENTPLESRMWFRMNFMSGLFSSKTLVSI